MRTTRLLALALLTSMVACGDDYASNAPPPPPPPPAPPVTPPPPPPPPPPAVKTLSAWINGVEWTPTTRVSALVMTGVNQVNVLAFDQQWTLQMWADGVTGPGTYAIGPVMSGANGPRASASFRDGGGMWSSVASGSSGAITFTIITPTRVAGSFEFVVNAHALSEVGGTITATRGAFDIALF